MLKDPTRSLSEPGFGSALSSHKMRARAASGMGELSSEVGPPRLFVTEPEDASVPRPRHVITVQDVTRGLGLDVASSERVLRMVAGTNVEYSPRAGQQRLAQGRGYLGEALRVIVPDVDTRGEIVRRALAFWRKTQATDGIRSPTMRAVIKADRFFGKPEPRLVLLLKASKGEPVGDHKYLKREPDGKGGWRYIYDVTSSDKSGKATARSGAGRSMSIEFHPKYGEGEFTDPEGVEHSLGSASHGDHPGVYLHKVRSKGGATFRSFYVGPSNMTPAQALDAAYNAWRKDEDNPKHEAKIEPGVFTHPDGDHFGFHVGHPDGTVTTNRLGERHASKEAAVAAANEHRAAAFGWRQGDKTKAKHAASRDKALSLARAAVDPSRQKTSAAPLKKSAGLERVNHKYLHRKPDGKGGWEYVYENDAREKYTHGDSPTTEQVIGRLRDHVSSTLNSPIKKTSDKTPDLSETRAILDELKSSVRSTADKKIASQALQYPIDRARTHATNMQLQGHQATLDARDVRDALVDASKEINTKRFGAAKPRKPKPERAPLAPARAGKINISTGPKGESGEAVDAKVFGQYAVHSDTGTHTLTHVPTGVKFLSGSSKVEVMSLARHLNERAPTALSTLKFGQATVASMNPEQKKEAYLLKWLIERHTSMLQAEKLHRRGKLSAEALAEYKRKLYKQASDEE